MTHATTLFCGCCAALLVPSLLAEQAAPADTLAREKVTVDIPTAPEGYRRPKDWKPTAYPKDLATLSREHSAAVMARAKAQMAKVDAVNAKGSYKAEGKSLDRHACPTWFVDAKLGIFIDWGPWSVASWCPYVKGKRLYPDWYEYRCDVDPNHRAYHEKNWGADFKRDHFLELFRGERFDAPALMRLFRDCGARYVVPFLKHHGGFCLWDCSYTFRDSVDRGAKRDFAREMADACRANGLKFGFYDSQCGEWEYPVLKDDGTIGMCLETNPELKPLTPDMEWKCSGKVAVKDVVRDYIVPQATEFIDKYDPDIFWGDYDWRTDAAKNGSYDIAAYMYNRAEGRKEVAVNDRYGNGTPEEVGDHFKGHKHKFHFLRTIRGDFYTDESGDTIDLLDPSKWHPWEGCTGISLAYGNHWQVNDPESVLSESAFVCLFADMVARGGNLLLLVNLDPQGEIPSVQKERLLQIGAWLKAYGEAIYATRVLKPFVTDAVSYTQSKDGARRYAIVKKPAAEVSLECAVPEGAAVRVLGRAEKLACRREGAKTVVTVPADLANATVPYALAVTCDIIP